MKKSPPVFKIAGLFGALPSLRQNALDLFVQSFQHCGDMARLRLGPFYAYLLFHPDHIQHVMQTHAENYTRETKGYRNLRLLLGRGLLTSEGELWRIQKQKSIKEFSPEQVNRTVPQMAAVVETKIAPWGNSQDQVADIYMEMKNLVLSMFDRVYFGDLLGERNIPLFTEASDELATFLFNRTVSPFCLPLAIPTTKHRLFNEKVQVIKKTIHQLIDQYIKTDRSDVRIVTAVIRGHGNTFMGQKEKERIFSEIFTYISLGYEATSRMLTWAWYALVQYPEIEQKVYEEIQRRPNDPLTAQDLNDLKYLDQVLKEVLRLYPPVWQFARLSLLADEIDGFYIPPKSSILISQYVTHRHPAFWEQPEKFKPERFSSANTKKNHPFAYFPFGGGPHACAGYHLAFIEAKLIMTMIMRRFRLRLVGPKIELKPMFTLAPKGPVLMRITKR